MKIRINFPFKSESNKSLKLYRGEGKGSEGDIIQWWSTEKSLAEGYAASYLDSRLSTKTFSFKNVVSISHDNYVLTPEDIAVMVDDASTKYIPNIEALAMMDVFESRFPPIVRSKGLRLRDYMATREYQKYIAHLCKEFGIEAIRSYEDRVETYGVIV